MKIKKVKPSSPRIDELDDVKVADFGLTRDLFEKQYFSTNLKEKRGKMPIKWMAIESLEEFVFTTKSDVVCVRS